ncbi:ribonuclease H-like protein [Trametes coccinea BRFM310]|uniref:ribonuclease H n=1 Tax=Trametes coccinea (strain BRFM310) TaxID=1353009 RepID=A0A1Y2IIU0_TRAC3|nr:ribonuclease H-like protein [Trametes coccinea BRFM310]
MGKSAQTAGFAGNKHQKFTSLEQARQYLTQNGVAVAVPPPSSTAASAVASSSRNPQPGSSTRGRAHRTKPYARIQPPLSSSAGKDSNSRNSQWAALTKEIIQDESGWDVVYSDGACKGNGKTNNRAELIAIVRVLETTPLAKRPLLIKTDSKYSISCFRHWMPKWVANDFKTSSGEAVKNAPLIQYLSSLLDERARHGQKVHLQYIKGHAGHEGNEGADRMANLGATLPLQPERDWKALMLAKFAERTSGPVATAGPSTGSASISNAELEEYASCLADDEEWLDEVARA